MPRDSCSPTGHRLNDPIAEVQREAGDAALCPQSVLKRRQKCLTIICAAKPCLPGRCHPKSSAWAARCHPKFSTHAHPGTILR